MERVFFGVEGNAGSELVGSSGKGGDEPEVEPGGRCGTSGEVTGEIREDCSGGYSDAFEGVFNCVGERSGGGEVEVSGDGDADGQREVGDRLRGLGLEERGERADPIEDELGEALEGDVFVACLRCTWAAVFQRNTSPNRFRYSLPADSYAANIPPRSSSRTRPCF